MWKERQFPSSFNGMLEDLRLYLLSSSMLMLFLKPKDVVQDEVFQYLSVVMLCQDDLPSKRKNTNIHRNYTTMFAWLSITVDNSCS